MDPVEKRIADLSAENQIKKFSKYIEQYSQRLHQLSQAQHQQSSLCNVVNDFVNVAIDMELEQVAVLDLIDSNRQAVQKTILVFYYLCLELKSLCETASTLHKEFLAKDEELTLVDDVLSDDGSGHIELHPQTIKLLDSLEFIQNAQNCIRRLILVAKSTVHQLMMLFRDPKQYRAVDVSFILSYIVDAMKQIHIFDVIIVESKLKFVWHIYKDRTYGHYQLIQSEHGLDTVKGVNKLIEELDVFFGATFFQMMLDCLDEVKVYGDKEIMSSFSSYTLAVIKQKLKEVHKFRLDISDFNEAARILDTTILGVFHHNFFGTLKSAYFKDILTANSKHCAVSLLPNILFNPDTFLRKYAKTLFKNYDVYAKNLSNQRRVALQTKMASLEKATQQFRVDVNSIISVVRYSFSQSGKFESLDDLRTSPNIIVRYLTIAGHLSNTIKTITALHISLVQPMNKSCLHHIGAMVEMLTSLKWSFVAFKRRILLAIQSVRQYYQYKVLTAAANVRAKFTKGTATDQRNDILSVLDIAEKCLSGPFTKKRLLIWTLISTEELKTTLSIDLSETQFNEILDNLWTLSSLKQTLFRLCDSSFLFTDKSILKTYLKVYLEQFKDLSRLPKFISAIPWWPDNEASSARTKLLRDEFKLCLTEELVQKVSNEIETMLRINFHRKLNAVKEAQLPDLKIRDPTIIIQLNPMMIMGEYVSLRDHIERYLSKTFYNLVTVSPHDWKTYRDMRNMAKSIYDLSTTSDGLPLRTVDQSCDVMDIMKNLDVFAQHYSYDIYEQVFVEKESSNKHLSTIHIDQMAQSIQTHGIGIINTTVNITYQFLKKKIYLLSRFLYDDRVKSRLMKDHKQVNTRLGQEGPVYPFEYAWNLNKSSKKLFNNFGGGFYMDSFRDLVIEIGNALGFVRMMRSGRLRMGGNAVRHFPKSQVVPSYVQVISDLGLKDVNDLKDAAENVDAALIGMSNNFTESADYLKMLVTAFKKHVHNDKFDHLKKFFLIVPALSINYVDYMLTLKDNLAKDHNSKVYQFCEDGFVIGIVYILTVLDQIQDFNSLHWFATVDKYYVQKIHELGANTSDDTVSPIELEKIKQTQSLSEKRLNSFKQEFSLLFYGLSSSKIFFQ